MAPRARFGLDHLFGNTTIQRNVNPRVVGKVRRSDPDGFSLIPYFPALTGKDLFIEYTKEISGVVTTFNVNLTFAADDVAAAIAQVNALDSANLEAQDLGGFFAIRNKNGGKTHYVAVNSGTSAAVFGFEVSPFPGFKSVAGEISSAPTNRDQKNPTGTAALAKDETLDSAAINRAISGFADVMARMLREQDREVVGFGQVTLAGANIFTIGSFLCLRFPTPVPGMRIPLLAFPDTPTPSAPTTGELSSLFRVQDASGDELVLSNKTVPRVLRVLWGNSSTVSTSNGAQAFSTYSPLPTPSAFSVFGSNPGGPVTKVVKKAAVTISEIRGNVVKCSGSPQFITSGILPGDTARIKNSGVTSPFSHNGEFIVDEVLTENSLVLRPKSKFEPLADSTSESPAGLNQGVTGMGDVEILVGAFLNGPGIIFMLDAAPSTAAEFQGAILHFATGVRVKESPVERFGRSPKGGIAGLIARLGSFVTPTTDGASFIGAASGSDLLTTTVRDQLDELATGWAKLDRENTWSKPQTVRGDSADDSPAFKTDVAPTGNRKLIWEFDTGSGTSVLRIYWSPGVIEIVSNAKWRPGTTDWQADDPLDSTLLFSIGSVEWQLKARNFSSPDVWDDFGWEAIPLYFNTLGFPGDLSFYFNNGSVTVGNTAQPSYSVRYGFKKNISEDDGLTRTSAGRTLLMDNLAGMPDNWGFGPKRGFRMYCSDAFFDDFGSFGDATGDSLELAFNCLWSPSLGQWEMDDETYDAMLVTIDPGIGVRINTRHVQGYAWTGVDSAFFDDVLLDPEYDQSIPASNQGWNAQTGLTNALDSYPGGTTYKNLLSHKSHPKAWGLIQMGSSVRTLIEGAGVSYIEGPGGSMLFTRVHWGSAFSLDLAGSGLPRYIIVPNIQSNPFGLVRRVAVYAQTADYVDLMMAEDDGTPLTIDIHDFTIGFVVFGVFDSLI